METVSNICRFIPLRKDFDSLHTINFVLETKPQPFDALKTTSLYRMHLVTRGTGILHTPGRTHPLKPGDLFFGLPALPFAIESLQDFEYLYISFIGPRANMLLDRLRINSQNYLFPDFQELTDFWDASIHSDPQLFDLRSESVLLYSFSVMGSRFLADPGLEKKSDTVFQIKKYIDDHYSDTDFSVEKLGTELSYNPKYVSTVFKQHFQMGISQYLNTVRIQHACTLMEQGFTCIKDIALLCGFKDPLYFSRVFKTHLGQSPRDYLRLSGKDS